MTRNEEPGGYGINGVIPGTGPCVVADCLRNAGSDALMCRAHWREVPPNRRAALSDTLFEWKQNTITLEDLREAQWACVKAIEG
jgi:hypothetical protein